MRTGPSISGCTPPSPSASSSSNARAGSFRSRSTSACGRYLQVLPGPSWCSARGRACVLAESGEIEFTPRDSSQQLQRGLVVHQRSACDGKPFSRPATGPCVSERRAGLAQCWRSRADPKSWQVPPRSGDRVGRHATRHGAHRRCSGRSSASHDVAAGQERRHLFEYRSSC